MTDLTYFEHSAGAQVVIHPLENTIIAANSDCKKLLELSIEEILTLKASRLFSPDVPALIVFSQEVLELKKAWSNQLLLNIHNCEIQVEVTGKRVDHGSHTFLYLSFQTSDELNTRRYNSDAQRHYLSGMGHWNRVSIVFQEFERENQLILDAVGEGIYGVDSNGMTTFVNPAAEKILGYNSQELAGRNMHNIIHHSHADGSHFSAEECPIFQAFRDGNIHRNDDDIFWSKTGQPIEVEYTSTPICDNGLTIGAVVVFRDISQRKSDKKRLIAALDEVKTLKNRLELENAYLQEEISSEFNHHQIVGKSPAIQNIIQQINLVAATDATVLIQGESGTGKELIARAIHETSARSQRSLIKVNCAAIPNDLFESEFFGHMKGAFTGATSDRPGRFELADGGTIFLDEVGEMPLHLQGKLLRVIQEQQFERVGDSKTRRVDVRIIAATNRKLKTLVEQKAFREDLYFRLNVFPIESASLRERLEDIPLLTQHFFERTIKKQARPNLRIPLSEIEKLLEYHWPGNIRELENVIERQVILARDETLRFERLTSIPKANVKTINIESSSVLTAGEMKTKDKDNIIAALDKCHGKVFGQDGAAQLLDIKPTTLSSRIKRYDINPRQFKSR